MILINFDMGFLRFKFNYKMSVTQCTRCSLWQIESRVFFGRKSTFCSIREMCGECVCVQQRMRKLFDYIYCGEYESLQCKNTQAERTKWIWRRQGRRQRQQRRHTNNLTSCHCLLVIQTDVILCSLFFATYIHSLPDVTPRVKERETQRMRYIGSGFIAIVFANFLCVFFFFFFIRLRYIVSKLWCTRSNWIFFFSAHRRTQTLSSSERRKSS